MDLGSNAGSLLYFPRHCEGCDSIVEGKRTLGTIRYGSRSPSHDSPDLSTFLKPLSPSSQWGMDSELLMMLESESSHKRAGA